MTLAVMVAGCSSGTKLLKEPVPLEAARPLVQVADARIAIAVDVVIVRNGSGSWASDADWDEYLIRARALTDEPVRITEIVIFDALDARVVSPAERSELVEATKETERRYEMSPQLARSEGGWMIVGGTATAVAGAGVLYGVAVASTVGAMGAGAGAVGGAALAIPLVAAVGGAIYAGRGIARMVNNSKVNDEIQRRQSVLPVTLARNADTRLDLFYPLTPLPSRIEIAYTDATGEQRLAIDTRASLGALHADAPTTLLQQVHPGTPKHAVRAGVTTGHVKARLTLRPDGSVRDAEIIESVPPGIFDGEARRAFWRWTYSRSRAEKRIVEAMIEFGR